MKLEQMLEAAAEAYGTIYPFADGEQYRAILVSGPAVNVDGTGGAWAACVVAGATGVRVGTAPIVHMCEFGATPEAAARALLRDIRADAEERLALVAKRASDEAERIKAIRKLTTEEPTP
jgi:hypothetical protein